MALRPAAWILRALAGYSIVIIAPITVLAVSLNIPLKELWLPCVLLLLAGTIAILIIWMASTFFNDPKQFAALLSLAVLLLFSSVTLVCSHFGAILGLFSKTFSITFAWVGLLGAAFSATHIFYLTYRRRLSAQRPNKIGRETR